ncbi:hypothetical protein PISMIDRAFT_680113 [Pisolithus microcarpus 441]|uniref:Uncharacterized protein n=1 Tax=Pisolithus microcarpus 441 TaxID=765257 RepID=A0A0C9Z0J1_9AGAM|nr:hypothetical protein PISMIDRAFT_680113 [Pisolithus microcarpus 441]
MNTITGDGVYGGEAGSFFVQTIRLTLVATSHEMNVALMFSAPSFKMTQNYMAC